MVKLFLDTDIGPDCDDAGALKVIHTLCDRGRAELLAVTHCTGNVYGLPAVSAINRFCGRETPLGTSPRKDFLSAENHMRYNRHLAEHFEHEFLDGRAQRDAREVFAGALADQADGSVTLLAIGPLNNLADYLADDVCRSLIEHKIDRLVSMAGRFDCDAPEWNLQMDIPAARFVLENWPTPVVLCGFECGYGVMTGEVLAGRPGNPVAEAYRLYTKGTMRRDSFDLATAFYAVMGDCDWIKASELGVITINEQGATSFHADPAGKHRYTVNSVAPEQMAKVLNDLL